MSATVLAKLEAEILLETAVVENTKQTSAEVYVSSFKFHASCQMLPDVHSAHCSGPSALIPGVFEAKWS